MDIEREEKERIRNDKVVLPTGGVEAKKTGKYGSFICIHTVTGCGRRELNTFPIM